MTKLYLLFFTAFLFVSCDNITDMIYQERYCGHDLYWSDDMEYLSDYYKMDNLDFYLYKVSLYIKGKVEYRIDIKDNASSPELTLKNGFGDCEDISILFLNIVFLTSGERGDLLLVESNRSICAGGFPDHAIVKVFDMKINPQTGLRKDYSTSYYYSFSQLFN